MISILDLTKQYAELKAEIDAAVTGVLGAGHFILGPNVKAFEAEFAQYLETAHGVGVNSGTDALHLALRALNIGAGDEVITSPFSFVATSEAISMTGARPVFVDIDPASYNIDPELIAPAITARTRAILPVHMYGAPARMDRIMQIAQRYGLAVVEDCAQAAGATFQGRKVGTFGNAGAFSFFPSKNLGACGDGGFVCTNDGDLAKRLRSLRAHGGAVKYHHEELGLNSRLDELQAAILRVKLPHLDRWVSARQAVARRYSAGLREAGDIRTPLEPVGGLHAYHQYTVRVERRDATQRSLAAAGIQSMVYYPVPLHLQVVHRQLGYRRGDFACAEQACEQVLSLPIYPELSAETQERVIAGLLDAACAVSAA